MSNLGVTPIYFSIHLDPTHLSVYSALFRNRLGTTVAARASGFSGILHYQNYLISPVPYKYLHKYCTFYLFRLFGTKCAKCSCIFTKNDLVMRAKNKIFHIDCFRCAACCRQLIPGDEFTLRDDGLYCKADHSSHEDPSDGGDGKLDITPFNKELKTSQSLHTPG